MVPAKVETLRLALNGSRLEHPPIFPESIRCLGLELQGTSIKFVGSTDSISKVRLPGCLQMQIDVTEATRSTFQWVAQVTAAATTIRDLCWCCMTPDPYFGLLLAIGSLSAAHSMERLALDVVYDTLELRVVSQALRNLAERITIKRFVLTMRNGNNIGTSAYVYNSAADDATGAWLTAIGHRSTQLRVTLVEFAPAALVRRLCTLAHQRSRVSVWSTVLSFSTPSVPLVIDRKARCNLREKVTMKVPDGLSFVFGSIRMRFFSPSGWTFLFDFSVHGFSFIRLCGQPNVQCQTWM